MLHGPCGSRNGADEVFGKAQIASRRSYGHGERQPGTWEYSSRPESRMRARSVSLFDLGQHVVDSTHRIVMLCCGADDFELLADAARSEEHTSELQSQSNLVCRLLLE